MSTSENWREGAACRGMDVNDFFPTAGDNIKAATAKAVCGRCPVRQDCLDDAIDFELTWGIPCCGVRGGLSEKERHQVKRSRRAA